MSCSIRTQNFLCETISTELLMTNKAAIMQEFRLWNETQKDPPYFPLHEQTQALFLHKRLLLKWEVCIDSEMYSCCRNLPHLQPTWLMVGRSRAKELTNLQIDSWFRIATPLRFAQVWSREAQEEQASEDVLPTNWRVGDHLLKKTRTAYKSHALWVSILQINFRNSLQHIFHWTTNSRMFFNNKEIVGRIKENSEVEPQRNKV